MRSSTSPLGLIIRRLGRRRSTSLPVGRATLPSANKLSIRARPETITPRWVFRLLGPTQLASATRLSALEHFGQVRLLTTTRRSATTRSAQIRPEEGTYEWKLMHAYLERQPARMYP